MKRARFTEEQIIAVLKEHEAGAKTADLARRHGISEATIYNWKAKFGGMVSPRPNGYRRLCVLLRREGVLSGINRIHRLYGEEGLTVRKRRARRKTRAAGRRSWWK
jgi:transposase-like protein